MRVAVVGATGNVGSAVLRELACEPSVEEVRALARRPPETQWERTRFSSVDITADDLTPHLEGVDVVIHLAWVFQPTHRPTETWRRNVGGAMRVFEAVATLGIPALVYASSVGAYSPRRGDGRVDESWPTDGLPTAGYGREKAYLERVLDAFEARSPTTRVVRLRTGFVFQEAASSQQRRLFAGPFVPTPLLRLAPVIPYPAGLRFQALHASDAARGYVLAAVGDAHGPFNLAAEPVIGGDEIGEVLSARVQPVPAKLVRAALSGAWHARLVPAEPSLFDLAMGLPVMSTARAKDELGWETRVAATDALARLVQGLVRGSGGETAPLAADSLKKRAEELASGVGQSP